MTNPIKRTLPRSLFGRSLLIIVSPLILLQIISTYIFYEQHWETLSRRLALSVAGDIAFVSDLMERFPDAQERTRTLQTARRATGVLFTFAPNTRLAPDISIPDDDGPDTLIESSLTERVLRPFTTDTISDDRHVLVDVQLADGVLTAVVSRKRLFSSTTYVFIIWMVGSSLILFGVASLFMRNQVRPIRRLADAAESFGKGQLVADFKPEGATEVRRAGIEFNRMRERITRQMQQRTEMLAGVSHDLRTPLTRIKLQLAMLGESDDIEELRADVTEMERMVEGYLAFVRGEAGEMAMPNDLRSLLDDVVAKARRSGTDVRLDMTEALTLPIKPNALSRAIANLIGNAGRHGKLVRVTARRRPGCAEITIDDDGPGIPEARREEVFKPFFRLDPSRNQATGGVGLGLTIARDLIRGHGGDLTLEDSPLGGLRAIVRLPG